MWKPKTATLTMTLKEGEWGSEVYVTISFQQGQPVTFTTSSSGSGSPVIEAEWLTRALLMMRKIAEASN